MAYSLLYSTGTVSVANGSTSVTGAGVTWSSVREGDTLRDPATGAFAMIASVDDTGGALTLLWPWPGTTLSDAAYIITYDSPARRSAVTLGAAVEAMVQNQTSLLARRADYLALGVLINDPPSSPTVGDLYVAGSAPTGAWAANAGYLATWTAAAAWAFTAPEAGMKVYDLSADPPVAYVRGSTSWVLASPEPHRGRNLLFNPCGLINQREATSQADDTYGFDRWVVLTQTGAVGLSTLTAPADGIAGMMRLTQSQATAQRMGQAQILEAADSRWMRGRTMTLSGKARCSAAATLRYAILAWTGTADAVTSDVVLDWTSGSFTTGGFFLASNLTVVAAGSTALTAGIITDLDALSAAMPSSLNNAIIVYWVDGTLAQSETLDVAIQFEEGAIAHALDVRPIAVERQMCRRYFQALGGDHPYQRFGHGVAISSTVARMNLFIPEMRVVPSATFSAAEHFSADDGVTPFVASAITAYDYTKQVFTVQLTSSGIATYRPYVMIAAGALSARIYISAEL